MAANPNSYATSAGLKPFAYDPADQSGTVRRRTARGGFSRFLIDVIIISAADCDGGVCSFCCSALSRSVSG